MNAQRPSRAGTIVVGCLLGLLLVGAWLLRHRHDAPLARAVSTAAPTAEPLALEELPRVSLKQSDLQQPWPFTVNEGSLWCIGYHGVNVVVFEAGGVRYAVNGKSRGRVTMGRYNLRDAAEISLDDPQTPRQKLNTSEVLERGLPLCQRSAASRSTSGAGLPKK